MNMHVPALTKGHGDKWAVYCLACSDAAGKWIYPCHALFGKGWPEVPPQELVAAPMEGDS